LITIATGNLPKFIICVVLDQPTLDHGEEITMIVTHNETNWTGAPSHGLLKIRKPLPVLLLGFIKGNPRSPNIVQSAHLEWSIF
jgi:hypothetical protein